MKPMLKKNVLAMLVAGLMTGALAGQAMAVTSTPTASVTGHAPVLAAGQIKYSDENNNGVLDTGDILSIDTTHEFTFSDADGDTAVDNTYSWKADGTEVATTATYTLTAADLGKVFNLAVTAHTDNTITDPADGTAVTSTNTLTASAADEILSVAITGGTGTANAPVVGDTLVATATCTATCGALNYQWQVEDNAGSGNYVDIAGATSASWQVTTSTQKRKIQVVVTNKVTP